MKYYMGLDISTQSAKIVVIDSKIHKTIYQNIVNYDKDLPQYGTRNGVRQGQEISLGVSESNPQMWLDAIHKLFHELSLRDGIIKNIKALSISGQQHGLVSLTAKGDLANPYSKLWNDFSTLEECDLLTKAVGGTDEMIKAVGNTQRTGYTAPKILYMKRHQPELFEKTAHFLLVHNYINWYLTGGKNGGRLVMEPGDVSGSALWNSKSRTWSDEVLEAISPDLKSKLPPVKDSRELIGKMRQDFCQKYGFSPDCAIASGSGDNMMGAIGTGNVEEGIVTISLGTSGTAYSYMKRAYIDPSGEIAAFCDATNNYLPLLCISNMANGYDDLLRHFSLSHSEFDQLISQTPIGNDGRILIPWYEGERTPDLPHAKPIYFGFKISDFNPIRLARAVLEGHIMNLYSGFQKLPIKPTEIRLTGGLAKSSSWQFAISNIFNTPTVYLEGEGAAFGAALHALWSHDKTFEIQEITRNFISFDQSTRIQPDPDAVSQYKKVFEVYQSLARRMIVSQGASPFDLSAKYFFKDKI
ncbi:MAG: xylulokinase [Promethearchaeota archaeon]